MYFHKQKTRKLFPGFFICPAGAHKSLISQPAHAQNLSPCRPDRQVLVHRDTLLLKVLIDLRPYISGRQRSLAKVL